MRYEMRRNKARLDLWGSFIIFFIGYTAFGVSLMVEWSIFLFTVGLLGMVFGGVILSMVYATIWNGFWRWFWLHFTDASYPPLVEWREEMKDRGVFFPGDA
jgi:hypothetical protein